MTNQPLELDIGKIYEEESERPPSEALGLRYNPFPPTGITGSGEFSGPFFLSSTIKEELNNFVARAVRQSDFCGVVLLGEYGAGKTALLKYFEKSASLAREKGHPLAAYYVSNPGTSFADVLQSMTESINREVLLKYSWAFFLVKLSEGIEESESYLEEIGLPNVEHRQLANIVDGHGFWKLFHEDLEIPPNDISDAVNEVMLGALADYSLAQDLSALMLGDRRTAAQSWSKLTRRLPSTSTKKPIPSERLEGLLAILRVNGIKHVFLLIDEFEDVVFHRMTKRLRDDFTATLRSLIAFHGSDLSIVFASNYAGWRLLTNSDPGLSERFPVEIELTEMFGENLRGLVNSYIKLAKVTDSKASDRFYSDSNLKLIEERSTTLARPLLSMLFRLTEEFYDAGKVPTEDEIREFLESD